MIYLFIISYIIIVIGIILLILSSIKVNKEVNLVRNNNCNYAILIPARDESKVIENLLKSIEIQNEDMSNVYVIVEDKDDITCKITKRYGANIYIRKKPVRSRKGYALDECIKKILKTKHYDLYFIFDADNILDSNFIKNMLKSWKKGYEITTGYRNILNPTNVVSGCSGLVFSLVNNVLNKQNIKHNRPIILSGTGFYISGRIIEQLHGFPFNTLTEDYDLSLYVSANNISCTYNDKAIFFDEQPTDLKCSMKQRTRWIKGFFETRKKRLKNVKGDLFQKLGIMPIVFTLVGLFLLFITSLINIFVSNKSYMLLFLIPIIIYVVLFLLTVLVLKKEKKYLNLNKSLKIKCLFFNPIFLSTFVICFFKAISNKDIKWDKINHNG